MRALVCLVVVWVVSRVALDGREIVVDLNGGGDFTEIQPAIDAADDGDTVLVKPGEYVITEPIDFNRLQDPEDPESPPVKSILLRSEAGAEDTTVRMSETPANPVRASVVIFESGEGGESMLDGFTLKGGRGTQWGERESGGGGVMCIKGSSPTLTSCTIAGNSAEHRGGGVSCDDGSCPTLTDCTIAGNSSCGLYCLGNSSPTLTNCTIAGNSGGGVYCSGDSSPTLTNCTISGGSAYYGGGAHCYESSPVFTNCTISGNWAYYGGGVYCFDSSPQLTNCIVWNNAGGSFHLSGEHSNPQIVFSCIEGDRVWPGEGNLNLDPLFCGWDGSEIEVNHQSELEDALTGFSLSLSAQSRCLGTGKDNANMGAGTGTCEVAGAGYRSLHLSAGTYSIEGLDLVYNVSIEGTGEEETVVEGTVYGLRTGATLSHLKVTGGTSGGIRVGPGEAPAISNCTITENSIAGWGNGGGVYCGAGSSPILTTCTISRNSTYIGGGVYSEEGSSPTLRNCTISGNSACFGGGVFSRGGSYPTLTDCKISGNSTRGGDSDICPGSGGGVSCGVGSSPMLENCTLSGNSAHEGGGVDCRAYSSPTLTNCTISGNSAKRDGGGVYCGKSSLPKLTNCIVWDNPGGSFDVDETSSPIVSYSCLETDEVWPGEGNISEDPLFVRRGSWEECDPASGTDCMPCEWDGEGKPVAWHRWTFDHRLQPDSPCVDGGTSEGAPSFDIEGNGRPCGAGVDMGAYETGDCPSPSPFRRADPNADGQQNVFDAVFTLLYLFSGGEAPTCLKAADSDDSGTVDITDAVYLLNYLFLGGPRLKGPFPDCGLDPTADELGCESFEACG